MIRSFACSDTARLFRLEKVRVFPPDIQRTALRKLAQLHAVSELIHLRVPPGGGGATGVAGGVVRGAAAREPSP